MPEPLRELTDSQAALLELLFLPENREILRSGSWSELTLKAGYAPGANKASVLNSRIFREALEERLGEYQVGIQFDAIMLTEDVITGNNLSPLAAVQLSAAKDVLDRSKKFVKTSESKIPVDAAAAIIYLPRKDEITDS